MRKCVSYVDINCHYLGVLPVDTRLHACTHTRMRVIRIARSVFVFVYKRAKCQSKRTFPAKTSILDNTMENDETAGPNANNCLGMYTWI